MQKLDGQKLPASFGNVKFEFGVERNNLMGTKRTFRKHGQCGMEVSDFLPHLAACADDLALLRGCYADTPNHAPATYQMNTGHVRMGYPSMGSWVTYGLGSENQNMSGFVVMPVSGMKGGAPAWGNGFLPAAYQGTVLRDGPAPLLYLTQSQEISATQQRRAVDFLNQLNAEHQRGREENSELTARIAAYETAFYMQAAAPGIVDVSKETAQTLRRYDPNGKPTGFALRCLLARRMVEHGIRFVQIYHGSGDGWDAHGNVESNHRELCKAIDYPTAGLLQDLKDRGLLDSTLVIWGGEFGRTPLTEGRDGRDHNHLGFSMWLAGGGIQGGLAHGATDEIGLRAVEGRVHIHDLHATILHLLGLDHEKLTYRYSGRDFRLTDVHGSVVKELLA